MYMEYLWDKGLPMGSTSVEGKKTKQEFREEELNQQPQPTPLEAWSYNGLSHGKAFPFHINQLLGFPVWLSAPVAISEGAEI